MSSPPTLAARRALIGRLSRLHGAHDDRTEAARRDYYAAQIMDAVERAVAAAPPFTAAQIQRIGAILDAAPVSAADTTAVAS